MNFLCLFLLLNEINIRRTVFFTKGLIRKDPHFVENDIK